MMTIRIGWRSMMVGLILGMLVSSAGVAFCAEKTASAKEPDEVAVLDTTMGRIVLEFFPDVAPNHVKNFKKLARSKFYDGTTFHRVIPGFMIQGGDPNSKDDDPTNDGTGGPGYKLKAEFNSRPHVRGTLSMARSRDPNSAGSQFFICVARAAYLDGKYTVFGRVVKGMDVVDKIVKVPRDSRDRPLKNVVVKSVRILSRSQWREQEKKGSEAKGKPKEGKPKQ